MKKVTRDFKGIWIPREIWESKDLTLQEKIFFVEISSLDNDDGCFASNQYFADFFGLSKVRVSEVISSLVEKKYISIVIDRTNGNKRTLRTLLKESLIPSQTKVYDPIKEKFAHNNTDSSTSISSNIVETTKENNLPINPSSATPVAVSDQRSRHPAIVAIRQLMKRFPDEILWDKIIRKLGTDFDADKLKECRIAWVERGYNRSSMSWLNWYFDKIPEKTNGTYRDKRTNDKIAETNIIAELRQKVANGSVSRPNDADSTRQLRGISTESHVGGQIG